MKKAIIYVKGHNQEMQEIFCRLYAKEKGYKVNFVTTDMQSVNNCDVLLVASVSRISRDKSKYYETINLLKEKGIEVKNVASSENAVDNFNFARMILKK